MNKLCSVSGSLHTEVKPTQVRIPEKVTTFALPLTGGLRILWGNVECRGCVWIIFWYKDSVLEEFEVRSRVLQGQS